MAPIAVRKGMDADELVVKINCQAVWLLSRELSSEREVVAKQAHCFRYAVTGQANILVGESVPSRP
jgi:hypothetical protein